MTATTDFDMAAIREELGLTRSQMAAMLETDRQTIQRMEMPLGAATRREPAVRMIRLLEAYRAGWRPIDWPVRTGPTPEWLGWLGGESAPVTGLVLVRYRDGIETTHPLDQSLFIWRHRGRFDDIVAYKQIL